MPTKNDVYIKRSCHKGKLRFMSINKYYKNTYEILFHISSRICRFICYDEDIINYIKRCQVDEKLTIWFIINSTKYNEKYYTDNIIKFIECPRLKEIDRLKDTDNDYLFNSKF